jgi:hypothetical protein
MGHPDLQLKTILKTTTVVATSRHISSDLVGESVILNLNTGMYFGLNEIGAYIWKLIQQPITVEQICGALTQEYEVDIEQCERETIALFQDLVAAQLVEVKASDSA